MPEQKYRRNAENHRLAEEVCRYLLENREQHITAEQLAARFHVSATRLKTSFQRRYGMPLHTYVRGEKMRSAARMLRETNESVLTVAMEHGYCNGSKFAKAFSDVMGMTPRQYRKTEKRCGV